MGENARQRVLVTGGSRGIGAAIVTHFANNGFDVVFSYHQDEQAANAMLRAGSDSGARVCAIRADLAVAGSAEFVVSETLRFLGGLDVLVNCAGVYPKASIRDTDSEMFRRTISLNVDAALATLRSALDALADGGGAVVNISSISAFEPRVGMIAYDSSKAALSALTKSAAVELGPLGIRVNAVAPGLVWARDLQEIAPELVAANLEHAPLGRLVQPDEVAQAVAFLAGPSAGSITGHVLVIDCGVSLVGYAHAIH